LPGIFERKAQSVIFARLFRAHVLLKLLSSPQFFQQLGLLNPARSLDQTAHEDRPDFAPYLQAASRRAEKPANMTLWATAREYRKFQQLWSLERSNTPTRKSNPMGPATGDARAKGNSRG